jgi:hypothetical protein
MKLINFFNYTNDIIMFLFNDKIYNISIPIFIIIYNTNIKVISQHQKDKSFLNY